MDGMPLWKAFPEEKTCKLFERRDLKGSMVFLSLEDGYEVMASRSEKDKLLMGKESLII
jgi:hypothetical protein